MAEANTKQVRILAPAILPRYGAKSIDDVVELPAAVADELVYGGAAIYAGRKASGAKAKTATSKRAAKRETATTE